MPGTPEEYLRFATAETTPETSLIPLWDDGTPVTDVEMRDILALAAYHRRMLRDKSKDGNPQRMAMRLLRSFLSPEQRRQLRSSKAFLVRTTAGHTYRISPKAGTTERVTRHGSRWYSALVFCLHDDRSDPSQAMPSADLSLAHLLMLSADEDEFLATANSRNSRDQLWNPGYLRRLREARRGRITPVHA